MKRDEEAMPIKTFMEGYRAITGNTEVEPYVMGAEHMQIILKEASLLESAASAKNSMFRCRRGEEEHIGRTSASASPVFSMGLR